MNCVAHYSCTRPSAALPIFRYFVDIIPMMLGYATRGMNDWAGPAMPPQGTGFRFRRRRAGRPPYRHFELRDVRCQFDKLPAQVLAYSRRYTASTAHSCRRRRHEGGWRRHLRRRPSVLPFSSCTMPQAARRRLQYCSAYASARREMPPVTARRSIFAFFSRPSSRRRRHAPYYHCSPPPPMEAAGLAGLLGDCGMNRPHAYRQAYHSATIR